MASKDIPSDRLVTPLSDEVGFLVVDCETTGLEDTARVIQLGIVALDPQGNFEWKFSSLVRGDGTSGSPEAQNVHKISASDLIDAPEFSEVIAPYLKLLRSRIVFAHHSMFDRGKMNFELALLGESPLPHFGCTKNLGEFLGYGRMRLQEGAHFFEIDAGKAHDAGDDASTAASILHIYLQRHPEKFSEYLTTISN
jgi:DNA polymerase-3 subunit epsilon